MSLLTENCWRLGSAFNFKVGGLFLNLKNNFNKEEEGFMDMISSFSGRKPLAEHLWNYDWGVHTRDLGSG